MQELKSPTTIRGFKNKGRLLWGLLIFNAVGTVAVSGFLFLWATNQISPVGQVKEAVASDQNQNPATSRSAEAFAIRFAKDYLYMVPGYEEDYTKRLQPYLVKGMDPQAGVDMHGATKYMISDDDIQIWDVKPVGKDRSIITLQVRLYSGTKKEDLKKTDRRLAVPVLATGSGQYAVYDYPYFLPLPKQSSISSSSVNVPGKLVPDQTLQNEVRGFLDTFFRAYADGRSEIKYMVKSEKPITGLGGMLKYQKIDQIEVYTNDSEYIAQADVLYQDQETGIKLKTAYVIHLKKEGNWFVTDLKSRSEGGSD